MAICWWKPMPPLSEASGPGNYGVLGSEKLICLLTNGYYYVLISSSKQWVDIHATRALRERLGGKHIASLETLKTALINGL